jgi:hypothetical protein
MLEIVLECLCGNRIEPDEFAEDTDEYSGSGTQWMCECGRLEREYEALHWKPAFWELCRIAKANKKPDQPYGWPTNRKKQRGLF